MNRHFRRFPVLLLALVCAGCGSGAADEAGDPALETDQAVLDSRLFCAPFTHPDKPPVLLVHGTFTNGTEQYDWTYIPLLSERGFDVCAVTYPDRGLGDMQVSAEYVVNALRRMHQQSGRKVAMIGHSQGVAVPRWALKWWKSARDAVSDFVMQAGPNHGTIIADPTSVLALLGIPLSGGAFPKPLPEAFHQFPPYSQFIAATNDGDETPGDISYTALYTTFDELVEPSAPVPTAAVDFGRNNPKVTNLLLQDLCPGRLVDHVSIGTTDRLSFELALDAISHPGPLDVERAGGSALCGLAPFIPDQIVATGAAAALLDILAQDVTNGAPNPHLALTEPELKPYAAHR